MSARVAGMAVEIAGEGEPVILVHGLGGTSNSFQPQMDVLRRHRAIRPDLPGSGRSPVPDKPLSIVGFAEAIVALARALGMEKPHLIGHSMGTIVCQWLAVEQPEMVRSLALCGALMEPPDAARAGLRARAAKARADGMAGIADAVAAGSTAAATKQDNPAAVAFVRESLMRQDPEGYARTCEALAEAKAADARQIGCPTLLITGEDDAVAPASVARTLAERIQGARAVVLPRCGHWATVERPREVNAALADFYTRNTR